MPPRFITEKFRYAKLADNERIFVFNSEKLDDITVDLDELRDPLLARFKTEDVKRLQLRTDDREIILVKEKDGKDKFKWRFEKVDSFDVESKAVDELLTVIASLQARDQQIDDRIDAKTAGLDKPRGQIRVFLEEAEKDEKKDDEDKKLADKEVKKKKREIVFHLGTKAATVVKDTSIDKEDFKDFFKDKDPFKEKNKAKPKDKGLIHVRVDGWERINLVTDELWTLASRPELAYRPRSCGASSRTRSRASRFRRTACRIISTVPTSHGKSAVRWKRRRRPRTSMRSRPSFRI